MSFSETNLFTTDVQYALWYPLSSLYALSLFTTLYSRKVINRQLGHVGPTSRSNNLTVDMAAIRRTGFSGAVGNMAGRNSMNNGTVADCYLCPGSGDDGIDIARTSSTSRENGGGIFGICRTKSVNSATRSTGAKKTMTVSTGPPRPPRRSPRWSFSTFGIGPAQPTYPSPALQIHVQTEKSIEWEDEDGNRGRRRRDSVMV